MPYLEREIPIDPLALVSPTFRGIVHRLNWYERPLDYIVWDGYKTGYYLNGTYIGQREDIRQMNADRIDEVAENTRANAEILLANEKKRFVFTDEDSEAISNAIDEQGAQSEEVIEAFIGAQNEQESSHRGFRSRRQKERLVPIPNIHYVLMSNDYGDTYACPLGLVKRTPALTFAKKLSTKEVADYHLFIYDMIKPGYKPTGNYALLSARKNVLDAAVASPAISAVTSAATSASTGATTSAPVSAAPTSASTSASVASAVANASVSAPIGADMVYRRRPLESFEGDFDEDETPENGLVEVVQSVVNLGANLVASAVREVAPDVATDLAKVPKPKESVALKGTPEGALVEVAESVTKLVTNTAAMALSDSLPDVAKAVAKQTREEEVRARAPASFEEVPDEEFGDIPPDEKYTDIAPDEIGLLPFHCETERRRIQWLHKKAVEESTNAPCESPVDGPVKGMESFVGGDFMQPEIDDQYACTTMSRARAESPLRRAPSPVRTRSPKKAKPVAKRHALASLGGYGSSDSFSESDSDKSGDETIVRQRKPIATN